VQDPPVTPVERLDDALRALGLALERLAEAFQIFECTLIVNGVPGDDLTPDRRIA
jgi:hypothetical protein